MKTKQKNQQQREPKQPKEINYKQIFAKKKNNEEKIKKLCPEATTKSGIYGFYRTDENGIHYGYIGQATKNLLSRMAQHLSGYQHIDISIKKHGLYDNIKNPYGYRCYVVCYCKAEECDEKEQYYIKLWANKGIQLRNTQSGGGLGRSNINDNKPSKGYYDGVAYGKKKIKQELNYIIDKYLVISLKKDNKLSQKALAKFYRILSEEKEKE